MLKDARKWVLKYVHGTKELTEIACEKKNELQDAGFNNSMEQ